METPPGLSTQLTTSSKKLADSNKTKTLLSSNGVGTPSKTLKLVNDSGTNKDMVNVVTLEPYNVEEISNTPILHVESLPLSWSFDVIYKEFEEFGTIQEIRNRLGKNYQFFETWIIFVKAKDAERACRDYSSDTVSIKCSLVDDIPRNCDVYRPPDENEDPKVSTEMLRLPKPPRWLILTTRNERGNLFKVKKFINQKLGLVGRPNISRFGRNSFLVHATSDGQAAMLLNMKMDPEGFIKEVKPH